MSHARTHYIKWTGRILAVLYTLFFSLLVFGVFGQGYTLKETLFELLIQLLPSVLLIVATIVAWRRPSLGGVWFVFHGLVSVFFFNMHMDWLTFIFVSILAVVIGGVLLWIDLGYDEEQSPQQAIG